MNFAFCCGFVNGCESDDNENQSVEIDKKRNLNLFLDPNFQWFHRLALYQFIEK